MNGNPGNRYQTLSRMGQAIPVHRQQNARVFLAARLLVLTGLAASLILGQSIALAKQTKTAGKSESPEGGNSGSIPTQANAPSPTPGNVENGKLMYTKNNCSTCHGIEGQGGVGPRLAPNPITFSAFMDQLRQPRDQMPPYTTKMLSNGEVADIYAYLNSIPKLPPAAAAPGNVENGRRLYTKDGCYECHDIQGQGGAGTGPQLAPNPITFSAFMDQLRQPRDQMPPYTAKVLSDAEVADIYAYLHSIPKPPQVSNTPLLQVK